MSSPTKQEANSEVTATSPHPSMTNGDGNNNMMMSSELQDSILVAYRSVGLGTFGAVMRFAGMPLEKIALFMNSSQVTGKNQFAQSIKLTFKEGALAPYKVVGPASLVAWFMQYSGMLCTSTCYYPFKLLTSLLTYTYDFLF